MSDYNGWSNRATWNAALWLYNDEGLYFGMPKAFTPNMIENYCREVWPNGETPDGESLDEVNWEEIVECDS